ncbi:outer membrane protein assembly factor BamB [Marilutibacter aestuarii]|uniref:Outer membrane protein assembly factor BamB n=1 Tax=Marilutibacter aestuarii TaxID=1706195 RepID=A0A508A921_9GAMM|nr:outer membrane protein assembly factor BamB [Lysobacter aestuarii]TQD46370.1 outer membrane protein assembly factor BamB [Lysobacter aestuarii]
MKSAPKRPLSFLLRGTLVVSCVFALAACSTVKGWFGGGKVKPNEPAELVEFAPSQTVAELWSTNVGKGEGRMGARQGPVVLDGRVYAAAVEGGVSALDLQSGNRLWHYDSELPVSGGPGVGDGLVVVGTLDGVVIALDAETGAERWQAEVPNEVIAAPAIGMGLVLVRSNDNRVTAFDAASGERRWFWNHDVPTLSVRGNDAPLLGPGFVFVGNDDGTVSALSLNDGRPLWEQAVGQQEGRTELDRMSDVDGTPVLDGQIIFATSYEGRTLAIDGPSGRPMWAAEEGGAGRIGVASDRLVVSSPSGSVYALDKRSGSAFWQQPALARRNPTGAAVQGDYAVVGDFEGYLHWMKLDNGEFAARVRAGRDPLRAAPVVADGILLVQNVDGRLSAFALR